MLQIYALPHECLVAVAARPISHAAFHAAATPAVDVLVDRHIPKAVSDRPKWPAYELPRNPLLVEDGPELPPAELRALFPWASVLIGCVEPDVCDILTMARLRRLFKEWPDAGPNANLGKVGDPTRQRRCPRVWLTQPITQSTEMNDRAAHKETIDAELGARRAAALDVNLPREVTVVPHVRSDAAVQVLAAWLRGVKHDQWFRAPDLRPGIDFLGEVEVDRPRQGVLVRRVVRLDEHFFDVSVELLQHYQPCFGWLSLNRATPMPWRWRAYWFSQYLRGRARGTFDIEYLEVYLSSMGSSALARSAAVRGEVSGLFIQESYFTRSCQI